MADGRSGIDWLYSALDALVDEFGLEDVVLVLDEAPFGRQVFRQGRRTLGDTWSEGVLFRGPDGIHVPSGILPAETAAAVSDLARVALRLDRFRHEASHDLLTGALNRRAFDEVLAAAAAQSERYGWSFLLVLVDLDGFKGVNDRFGHAMGDDCLRTVGAELRRGLRSGDIAARVGGDEFALVLAAATTDTVKNLEARLHNALDAALPDIGIGFSTGIAAAPVDGTDPHGLFKVADERLYEAKRR